MLPSVRSRFPASLTVGLFLVLLGAVGRGHASGPLVISEFLASNAAGLRDEDGDREDWIELRNISGAVVDAGGWSLTDDVAVPRRWVLPSTNVPPGGFLVVFASGKDRAVAGAALHASFRLNNAGEYLALVQPDGETVASAFEPEYPPQTEDTSFGTAADGTLKFFRPPTPGAANAEGFVARVGDVSFSVDRGLYTSAFDLILRCRTPGAEIRYTTNGTPPTASSGMVYSGPLRVAGTTVVRAAGFLPGWLPGGVDTQTYLFPADIVRQSPTGAAPPGWPASWGANVRDYGMDPDVVNHAKYGPLMDGALRSLPAFCVTVHLPDLFDPTRGIYANPGQDGRSWERPMSLELVYPDGRDGFQVDGGIRIRGGFSRSTGNPKHAFRFFFRPEYGEGRLRFPLFGEGAADEFEGFDLRTFQNYSWSFQGDANGTFLRDVFNRDAQLAMGHPGERGDYYHLYINGQYWGLFNTCERPEASYAEAYFGGDSDDYDVIKVEAGPYTILATDGDLRGWTALYNLARGTVGDALYRRLLGQNPDGTRNPDYPVYVDPVNLIDYMLVILYGGNLDAPISNFLGNTSPNNFFGVWNRVARDQGFRFFVHDAEHTLLDVNADRTGPYPAGNSSVTKSNPQWLWQKLLGSQDFRILVGDRIQRHLFNGGVLTPEGARALYQRRRAEIELAVVAESARWGDAQRASSPLMRDEHWVPAVNRNLQFIANRTAVLLQQLRNDGLYPSVATPQFNQQGGVVNAGFGLLMAPQGVDIYYTVDGSDPRLPGGALASSARKYTGAVRLLESTVVRARTRSDSAWSAVNEAEFIVSQTFTELRITEVHYHPPDSADLDGDEFEFIELKNVGSRELDLSGVHFTEGITFRFPNGTRLGPGQFVVLARNADAFRSRYPERTVAGVYSGRLSNSGERITVVHATGVPLETVSYGTRPPWPQLADGGGFSLVPVQSRGAVSDSPSEWRASAAAGGSPGEDDPSPTVVPVVIHEILTHTDPPQVDTVELHNPSGQPAPIGGWWLTDDPAEPRKFRIPAGRTVPPGGFLILSELDFNRPIDAPTSFSFSSHGDEAWIFSADAAGNLTGYSDGVAFPASENGVSFGRHTNSVGQVRFPAQVRVTLGLPNAGPRVGPVVLNEIQYRPVPGEAEFVEVRNLTAEAVPLYDVLAPTNRWRLGGVGFRFPEGAFLPPNGLAVVASTDPVAFRARHGIPEAVPVYGPFEGSLQDTGERVTLEKPDSPDLMPDGTWFVPYVVVDEVSYLAGAPWPVLSPGGLTALERLAPAGYGDDPGQWRAGLGESSPGFANDANRAPQVEAGSDLEVESTLFPVEVGLRGAGTDDGLPVVPGRVAFAWSQVSGPGPVQFADAGRSNTVVALPGSGEYRLRLVATDGERSRSDEVVVTARRPSGLASLVPPGSVWRYLDDGSDQGIAWRQPDFADAGWPTGPAQLGFGDGDEATVIRASAGGQRIVTFYFRREFAVSDPGAVRGLTVRLMRDDGALVYLNGTLVFRSNMPEGAVGAGTLASEVVGGGDESAYFDQAVDATLLVAGRNVLAVEVHQQNAGSSDVSFDLRLDAEVNPANRAPTADAGSDQTVAAGVALRLAGRYTDDGLPAPPGVPTFRWSQVSGPGTVVFQAASQPVTEAVFPVAGDYTLRFTVDDGAAEAADEVRVTVGGDPYRAWLEAHFSAAELADGRVSGEEADPDGDEQSNRAEYLSGTRPRDPSSVLRLGWKPSGAGRALQVPVVPGRTYTVLGRPAVDGGAWQAVSRLEALDCECAVEVDVSGHAEGAWFYRVVTPAQP